MSAVWRGLPDGYKQVEWIASSNTQYIKTNYIPNQNTRVLTKAKFLVGSSSAYLFGARQASAVNDYTFLTYNGTYRSVYNATSQYFASSVTFTEPFVIDKNKNVTTLNETHSVEATYATFASPVPLYIFGMNNNGNVGSRCTATMYYFMVYEGNVLVLDLVPCVNASNEAGFYDMINGEFYPNAGTGAFTVGDEVKAPAIAPTNLHQVFAVILAWDNMSAEHYNVYRDGKLIGSTTTTTFVDSTVENDTEYIYTVSSVSSGQESEQSNEIKILALDGYLIVRTEITSAFFQ